MKILDFLLFEIKILHKVRAVSVLLFSFQMISVLTLPFLLDSQDISIYAPQILVFCMAQSVILANSHNFLADKTDGTLVQKFLIFDYLYIVIVKQLSIFIISILINCLISVMVWILYSINFIQFLFFFATNFLVLLVSSALSSCSSIIKLYFDNNSEYLSMVMMPILIPFFICGSTAITSCNPFYILLLLGMNLILVPIITFLGVYLIRGESE